MILQPCPTTGRAPMSRYSRFLDFYRIEAQCCDTHVIHTTLVNDRSQIDVRRVKQTRRWDDVGRIGFGLFGEIWLQRSDGEERAIKKLAKYKLAEFGIDYKKELDALIKFNNPRVPISFIVTLILLPRPDLLMKRRQIP